MRVEDHPHELLRRAEQFATVIFLATSPGEHGELDRHELEALNSIVGEHMVLLRRANALLEADDEQPHAHHGRLVPRDAEDEEELTQ